MPFDCATFPANNSIKFIAKTLDFNIISEYDLAVYKHEQVKKNPGSWIYRNREKIEIFLSKLIINAFRIAIASICLSLTSFIFDYFYISEITFAIMLCSTFTIFSIACTIAFPILVKGPAYWEEQKINNFDDVPKPIADKAKQIKKLIPNVKFYEGKLIQSKIVLDDPYLIAVYNNEEICLGIWDSKGIIWQA
jgi:hypothetical protein